MAPVSDSARVRTFTHLGNRAATCFQQLPGKFGWQGNCSSAARKFIMAYVITGTCTKDELCVEACPVDCIHPKKDEAGFEEAPHLYVNPADCIDCGACVPVCPTNSIFPIDEVPADLAEFTAANAAYFN